MQNLLQSGSHDGWLLTESLGAMRDGGAGMASVAVLPCRKTAVGMKIIGNCEGGNCEAAICDGRGCDAGAIL